MGKIMVHNSIEVQPWSSPFREECVSSERSILAADGLIPPPPPIKCGSPFISAGGMTQIPSGGLKLQVVANPTIYPMFFSYTYIPVVKVSL